MDFHIDKKTAYLMLGALVIGMVTGAWLSNMSMHHHMSRMMRGGDMDMMMHKNMYKKGYIKNSSTDNMINNSGQYGNPESTVQVNPDITNQQVSIPQ